MLFSIFVNRRGGGITTFSLIVNALVMSTFVPVAVGAENYQGVLLDEGVTSQPQGGRLLLANALLPSPMQEALFSLAPEEDSPQILPPLKTPRVFPRDLFSPMPDNSTIEVTEPVESPAEQEETMRLARFLPKDSKYAGMLSTMDSLLAKALEDRDNQTSEQEKMVLAYQSAADPLPNPDTRTEAEVLLDNGFDYFQQRNIYGAVTSFFDVVNRFPESESSDLLDNAINAISWDADRGLIEIAEMKQITDGMPNYQDCQSDKAVYWLVAAHQLTGHALSEAGQKEDAKVYLDYARDAALAAMKDIPNSDYQIFMPGHYLLSCRDLGKEALKDGIKQVKQIIREQKTNNILKLAARRAICVNLRRVFNDNEEAGLQLYNLLDEWTDSEAAAILESKTSAPNILGHLEFTLGYARFQLSQFTPAREHFSKVANLYPENYRLAESAAYMVAYLTELINARNSEAGIEAYAAYLEAYPDGPNVEKALMRVGAAYDRMGRLSDAAATYRQVLTYFPDVPNRANLEHLASSLEEAVDAGEETRMLVDNVAAVFGNNLCGPYALALLLVSQNKEADLRILAEAADSTTEGTSLSGLMQAATEAGLTVYAEKVEDIRELSAPVIAHFTEGHYVFVSTIQTDKITFEDVSGVQTLSPADFNALFSGYVITLRNLKDGEYITQEIMDSIRGGCDDFFDLDEAYIQCVNQDNLGCGGDGRNNNSGAGVVGGGVAGANSPNSLGSLPPGPKYSPGFISTPGAMANPGDPNPSPNIPFNSSACGLYMGTNQRAIVMAKTDLSVNIRAKLDFAFKRVYYNPWGGHRNYRGEETRPYKNNIGHGWVHNFNTHLRVSSQNGFVAFVNADGNFKRYALDEEDVNGYDIYRMEPLDMDDEGDPNTLTSERAIIIRRSVSSGWFEMDFPDGLTCHFSAPIHAEEKYCRLEWFEDTTGNRVELTYADCILDTDDDQVPDTNFGRLSRVDAPDYDGRYFEFTYSGNRITDVELCAGEGVNKEVLQYVEYTYGYYKDGDSYYGANFLRSVQMNGDNNDVVEFEYEDGEYNQERVVMGIYPARITDKEGNDLLMEFEYDYVGSESFISTSGITMTFPNGLEMVFDKLASYTTEIKCYDDTTVISKFKYVMGAHGVIVNTAYYYPDPTSATSVSWTYTYQNIYDLYEVKKGGYVKAKYWYNEDTGRAEKSYVNGVYYRYEYENVGDLYPYRMYGPGLQSDSYKGPMTEISYDAYGRYSQIKPPNMGTNGINYTYDSYGQITEIENASSNSETFTYDTNGNMSSHTDFESNTTNYYYNDVGNVTGVKHPNSTLNINTWTLYEYESGGCSCTGGSGQVTSITRPGGAEIEFDYDNNGQMVLQTDPLGNETAYEYDSMGNLTSITTEEEREQTFEYDLLGNMIASTDFEGKVTKYEYDYRGLLLKKYLENDSSTEDDDDVLVENEYDDYGRLVTVIDGEEQEINFTYNSNNQLIQTSHGSYVANSNTGPIHIFREYDSYGRLTKESARTLWPTYATNIDPIEYTYDNTTGQLTQKKYTNYDAGLQQNIVRYVDYEYDDEGRLSVADDWASRTVSTDGHEFAYDDNGRLLTYTDFDGEELDYTYDNMGRVVAMDAYEYNNNYAYTYNAAGQLYTTTAPGNKEWEFSYNLAGQITSYTWPNGMSTHYDYDDDGRLTDIQHKDGATVEEGWAYTLNEGGNIRHVINAADDSDDEAWEYYYDSRERLTEALQRGDLSEPEWCYVYTYDKADNMTSKIKYEAEVYNRFYDTDEYYNWTAVSGTWDAEDVLSYTVASGEKRIYDPHTEGDHEAWFSFKRVGTLDSAGDGFRVRLRNIDANNYLDVRWGLGVTVIEECVSGTTNTLTTLANVGDEEGVWYDVYVELDDDDVLMYVGERGDDMTKVVDTTTNVASSTNRIEIIVSSGLSEFHFDDIKVMKRQLGDKTMTMTYGEGNQLTNIVRADGVEIDIEYDAWGRASGFEMDVLGLYTYTSEFTYWFGDKLKRVESDVPGMPEEVNFVYDGLGKRRIKLVDDEDMIHYRWDAGYKVLAEYEDDTTAWDIEGFKRFFVPKGHTAFAEAVPDGTGDPAAGTYTYLAHDHLGTGRFSYNQAKSQTGMVEHDPYGERIASSGYVPYHEFTGKPLDSETGMYYFPYRYYHPYLSRWTTPDPAGLIDGPNVYGYVGGDPIRNSDTLGLSLNEMLNPDDYTGTSFYRITGNCKGKGQAIRAAVKRVCSNLGSLVVDPGIRKCIQKRCKNPKINCDPCSKEKGYHDTTIYHTPFGDIEVRSETINIGVAAASDHEYGSILIHEWTHSCGDDMGEP